MVSPKGKTRTDHPLGKNPDFIDVFFYFDSWRTGQQRFSHFGMGLTGLNQYLAVEKVFVQGHNTVTVCSVRWYGDLEERMRHMYETIKC